MNARLPVLTLRQRLRRTIAIARVLGEIGFAALAAPFAFAYGFIRRRRRG